jgi:glycosyltransferase 2 family protein
MRWLRLAVPVLLLGILWYLADGEKAVARLRQAEPVWLLLAIVALHAQTILSALRWQRVASALGQPMTQGHAVREYYVAQVVNQTLPGGVVGDGARAVRAAPPGDLSAAMAAVALERALGQAALLAVMVVGFAASFAVGRIAWPAGALPFALLALAGVVMAVGVVVTRATGLRRMIGPAFAPVGQKLRLSVLSLAIVTLNLAAFVATARATGTTLTPEAILTVIPLILTAMLIPLTVGGWGWREGAAFALLPLAGATPDAGLVASATYGVLILSAALPGAFWLIRPALCPPAR